VDVPTSPWGNEGRPYEKTKWIDKALVRILYYSLLLAEKQGKPATPTPPHHHGAAGPPRSTT